MSLMDEYLSKKMNSIDLENELLELINQYNQMQNTFMLVYAASLSKPIYDAQLNMEDYYNLHDVLNNISSKSLHFYIETPGGRGETAEEIVKFLHSKFKEVSFVISGEAKSAGTIMVLGGDEIYMTDTGSLGPIDAQLQIGRTRISAYDYMEWINQKKDEANINQKLNPLDATMVAQISPGELQLVYHSLKYAEDLVVEWLPKYKFRNWKYTESRHIEVTEDMKKQRALEIANELMNHAKWRSHGRSLKIEDFDIMQLRINRIDNNPEVAEIVYRIQTIIRLLFNTTNMYKVIATEKVKILKGAMPIGLKPPTLNRESDVVIVEIKCNKCGDVHKLYAKTKDDKRIDMDFQKRGFKPFPPDDKLKCKCNYEIDLINLRNEIEARLGKKINL